MQGYIYFYSDAGGICTLKYAMSSAYLGSKLFGGRILRTETKVEVRNGLQSIRTIPKVNMVSRIGADHDPGGNVGAQFPYKSRGRPTFNLPTSVHLWYEITTVVVLGSTGLGDRNVCSQAPSG